MTSSGSVAVMRRTISLLAASPGTIARVPLWSLMASSRRSRRSLALRELSSGPWQLKHLLEMMGRICALKSTGSVADCFLALAANAAPIEHVATRVKAVSRARAGIRCFMQFLNDCLVLCHNVCRQDAGSTLNRYDAGNSLEQARAKNASRRRLATR